jgi:hypothetical protein
LKTSWFVVEKPEKFRAKLERHNIDAKVEWHQTRISIPVYHNMTDVDRLLDAFNSLGGMSLRRHLQAANELRQVGIA